MWTQYFCRSKHLCPINFGLNFWFALANNVKTNIQAEVLKATVYVCQFSSFPPLLQEQHGPNSCSPVWISELEDMWSNRRANAKFQLACSKRRISYCCKLLKYWGHLLYSKTRQKLIQCVLLHNQKNRFHCFNL